jgi:hypothetical protein
MISGGTGPAAAVPALLRKNEHYLPLFSSIHSTFTMRYLRQFREEARKK